ncbi:ATP-binding protein [Lacinutrix jangbogonensis]|uniref:ATP-binding protein n=1 Tax=Lacinutrix jangbogonensis TaxID=1469557 RepID=UPI00068EB042|nr:ATP-binding protein [Lacinutrix jangbogonensis]
MTFKNIFLLILIFGFSYLGFSQNNSYLDSLSVSISSLSKDNQVEQILNIPYDKAVGNIVVFEKLADRAILFSIKLEDSLKLAAAFEQKILALHFTSKNEEALQLSLRCIRIYEKYNKLIKVGKLYSDLGWKLKHRDFDKAFVYMQKGINIREKNKDSSNSLYASYDNFGVLHGMKKHWDSALYYHNKSLKYRKSIHDSVSIPFGYAHIANVYLNTQKFKLAEKYLDSSLYIREKRNDVYGVTDSKLYLGDLFFAKKEFEKAEKKFSEAFYLSSKYKYYPLKKYASEYLYKCNYSLKNYKKALKYNLIFNKLKDSVSNVETNSKIAELEIEYQSEKKEKEILKQRANIAEQSLTIQTRNYQVFGLIAFVIVLGFLGYLFYNQQKLINQQLKKDNELKEALTKIETQNRLQDQRLRISRDLHDNIGAQLTFIISSIDNLKYGFKLRDTLNSKLETISTFTTATIYELRDTIWAMNKNEITLDDLQSRISNFVDKANSVSDAITFEFKVEEKTQKYLILTSIEGMNVYRIIQESVNNALKYADASKIEVYINSSNNKLNVTILDNGKGFDLETLALGNGLNNIKKRALDIRAQVYIESSPGNGVSVKLEKKLNT